MKELNGLTLKEMLISGANNLYNNYPTIDALNVFPVPDGDTGMNMNLTVSSGAKEIVNRNDTDIYQIAKAFSKGLLMGARGNSGVITSQIFRGFANALEGKQKITAIEFAEAWLSGRDVAYKAVMRPVEGTMLTVIREAAETLNEQVKPDWSIEKAFEVLLKEAEASLERTPDLLPVLKEVGVVDSGGAGLVTIFTGMQLGMLGRVVAKTTATAVDQNQAIQMAGASIEATEEFGYCTEFILKIGEGENKRPFQEKRFANVLNSQGNSIVMVRDDELLKVHIHTLKPGNTFNYAQQFGEFLTLKCENMSEQHSHLSDDHHHASFEGNASEQAPVETKEFGIIAVASGDGLEKLFKEYRVDYVVKGGQTMNPSTEDFLEAVKKVNAKNIFILPNNGNIILAANQAAAVLAEEGKINARVIPSKTIPEGLVAAMNFNPEVSLDENKDEMSESLSSIKTGQVTFAIKDTTIEGVEVKKDFYMALSGKQILLSVEDKFVALKELVKSMVNEMSSIVTLIYGEDVNGDDAEAVVEELEVSYPDVEFELVEGNQPVYSFIIGVE